LKRVLVVSWVLVAGSISLVGQGSGFKAAASMNFFVTSKGLGDGANLGGIAGADYHCQQLAAAAGSQRTFYAYLSTRPGNGVTTLHGKDRIGKGPFYNSKGTLVAKDVADLHGPAAGLTKESALTEKGEMVARHDILTGSKPDGTAYTDGMDHTCNGYTSNRPNGSVQVGHSDRSNNSSWNSAHASKGCSQANLASTGGDGQFYCFAID
jgi:hypothetical protein